MSRESKIILSIVAVIIVGIVGLVTFVNSSTGSNSSEAPERLVRDDSRKIGSGEVQVVEFGDYQCPACAQAHPVTKKIIEEYKGKVTFVFRHFPLIQIHPNALPASKAAEAAGEQGKFWEMHDKLYDNQQVWSVMADPTNTFSNYASELGLDEEKFKIALKSEAIAERIDQDQSDGYAVGVSSTPTFFVNGKVIRQFDYDSLKNAIDSELN
jgi:protein-disulfide isomerase